MLSVLSTASPRCTDTYLILRLEMKLLSRIVVKRSIKRLVYRFNSGVLQ